MEAIKIILFVLLFFTIFILFLLSVNFINTNTNTEKYQNNDVDNLGLIDINIEDTDEDKPFMEHTTNSYGKSLKYDITRYNKSNKSRSNVRGSRY
jgi:hypothetical protein